MPKIRVSIMLPFALRIQEGSYQTSPAGEAIGIAAGPLEETKPETKIFADFQHEDLTNLDEIQRLRIRDADLLLKRSNRMLRWYRAIRRRADITELTRAQASPFRFELIEESPNAKEWIVPLEYEEIGPTPIKMAIEELTKAVQEGLKSGNEPDVDVLFLLDAERALQQGRFREAVLFCWSTIDSIFNRKFDLLANAATLGEWSEAREFLKGFDFGMRHKMTVGMRFVANRSLFNEPDDFWNRLSASYKKRNKIIHEGQTAVEDEAQQAIQIARRLVEIMNEIPIPTI